MRLSGTSFPHRASDHDAVRAPDHAATGKWRAATENLRRLSGCVVAGLVRVFGQRQAIFKGCGAVLLGMLPVEARSEALGPALAVPLLPAKEVH